MIYIIKNLGTIISSIFGYFIGSFSWSIFISKKFYKIDIRKYYSKNAGAANITRVLGKKIGFLVLVLDMFKIFLTFLFSFIISLIKIKKINLNLGNTSYIIPLFFALIAHGWPIYYKFKGGKTVSSFLSLLLISNIYYFLITSLIWWITFFIWKKFSLSSVISTIIIIFICWIPWLSGVDYISFDENNLKYINTNFILINKLHNINYYNYYDSLGKINIIIDLSGIILIIKHYENIKRIFFGKEIKFNNFKKNNNIKK